jgi:uncharacterized membrane protein YeiH
LENLFTILPDLVGTFAFAISGIKLASGKQVDWLGAYIIGLATAIGGGTIRDLLLGVTPFWMLDSRYFICHYFSLSTGLTEIIAASVVILIRVIAVKFHIQLPILKSIEQVTK